MKSCISNNEFSPNKLFDKVKNFTDYFFASFDQQTKGGLLNKHIIL